MNIAGGIIGKRGGDHGIFIAPPGVDAASASANDLMLHITAATAQAVMLGVAAPAFPRIVPHPLGYPPIAFPNLISTDMVGGFGYVRPFDNSWAPLTLSTISVDASNLTVSQSYVGGTVPLNVYYSVFNRRAP